MTNRHPSSHDESPSMTSSRLNHPSSQNCIVSSPDTVMRRAKTLIHRPLTISKALRRTNRDQTTLPAILDNVKYTLDEDRDWMCRVRFQIVHKEQGLMEDWRFILHLDHIGAIMKVMETYVIFQMVETWDNFPTGMRSFLGSPTDDSTDDHFKVEFYGHDDEPFDLDAERANLLQHSLQVEDRLVGNKDGTNCYFRGLPVTGMMPETLITLFVAEILIKD